jgi:uncharacterized membrane protein YeaQ/YmgE (transglycosylase-associated protein family)
MLLNIITWVGIGILAGFVVSLLIPNKNKYLAGTVSAGIVGAFVGGIIYSALQIGNIALTLDPAAAGISVLGSLILIYFIRLLVKSENKLSESN